jgi:hypothetical protein
MNGARKRQIKAYCQQKTNPIVIPASMAKAPSIYGAKLSEPIPLIIAVSSAIADVKTLDAFSFSSNQPMCFSRISLYNTDLILKVTFSPRVLKLIL